MKFLHLPQTDPYLNLATEEYLFQNYEDEFFLLWQNANTIVVGKHQQTLAEINVSLSNALDIRVVRRMTGGGTVYHDLGNLNFSFIRNVEKQLRPLDVFKAFTLPVIHALQGLGLPAEVDGRNDILIEGKKVSGNALFVKGERILEHGTLLVNADLSVLGRVLTPKQNKFEGKATQSVASRVGNLSDWLTAPLSIQDLCARILEKVKIAFPDTVEFTLSPQDWKHIKALAQSKYETPEWNYGKSPACSFERSIKCEAGNITAHLLLQGNTLQQVTFSGDFFVLQPVEELEAKLQGCALDNTELEERITALKPETYFSGLSAYEFLNLFR